MVQRVAFSCRVSVGLAMLAAAVVLPGLTHGQRLEDGLAALEKKEKATRPQIKQLFTGEVRADPKDKEHQEAIAVAAAYVTYPLTDPENQRKPGHINRIYTEFEVQLGRLAKFKPNTNTATQMYCRQVINRAQEVIQKRKQPIVTINATRILARIVERQWGPRTTAKDWENEVLPRLADDNARHLAEVLTGLVKDPKQIDGVRYHALRGLYSLLSFPRQETPLLPKATEDEALRAAQQVVQREVKFRPGTPREEINGFRVLRREAVRVLALGSSPTLGEKDRPALVLLRVVARDARVVPSPGIAERLEAAIGLARIRPEPKSRDYHSDYAAYYITRFVVDFGQAYADNQARETKTKEKVPAHLLRRRPWKVDAARLADALDALKIEVKDAYVGRAVDACQGVLGPMEKYAEVAPNELQNWLDTNPSPSKELFQGVEESAVVEGGKPDETEKKLETKPEKTTKPAKKPVKKTEKKIKKKIEKKKKPGG
jgi:hypothetical protein